MQPRSFTPEEFFKHARPAGVTRANLIQMSYYYQRECWTRAGASWNPLNRDQPITAPTTE